jgi:hypothetical protein
MNKLRDEFINDNPESGYTADLSQLSERTLLEIYLQWNGVIGYTDQIIAALDGIRAFKSFAPDTATSAQIMAEWAGRHEDRMMILGKPVENIEYDDEPYDTGL